MSFIYILMTHLINIVSTKMCLVRILDHMTDETFIHKLFTNNPVKSLSSIMVSIVSKDKEIYLTKKEVTHNLILPGLSD